MNPISLSVAFVPYQKPPPADAAPTKPAPAAAQPQRGSEAYDTPRRSPLFRALVEALESVVGSMQAPGTKTVEAPAPAAVPIVPAAAAAAAGSATDVMEVADPVATPVSAPAQSDGDDRPVDLEQAVLKFAKALMQVMRGAIQGEDGSMGQGHGHHVHQHHLHGSHAKWGDPAQRVEQVAVKVGATLPVEPKADVAPAAVAAAPAIVSAAIAVVNDVAEPLPTQDLPRADAGSTMIVVKLSINDLAPANARAEHAEQSLVNAFATLRKALGADENDASPTVREQLSAFLQVLAEQLRTGEVDAYQAMQPGALLHVTA